jgi:hypothetical protein
MATCPKCGSHLTSNHRCKVSTQREVFDAVAMGLAGGVTAFLAAAAFDQQSQLQAYDGLTFILGAALAIAAHFLLKRRL